MPNMSPKKAPMPSQDPNVRNKNFLEVATGYTEEVAIEEAQRCLNCKHRPCVNGCPVHIAIPDFIKEVAQGNFAGAYDVISQSSSLPAVCVLTSGIVACLPFAAVFVRRSHSVSQSA